MNPHLDLLKPLRTRNGLYTAHYLGLTLEGMPVFKLCAVATGEDTNRPHHLGLVVVNRKGLQTHAGEMGLDIINPEPEPKFVPWTMETAPRPCYVRGKSSNVDHLITGYAPACVKIDGVWIAWQSLFDNYNQVIGKNADTVCGTKE